MPMIEYHRDFLLKGTEHEMSMPGYQRDFLLKGGSARDCFFTCPLLSRKDFIALFDLGSKLRVEIDKGFPYSYLIQRVRREPICEERNGIYE
jgi:hypothetical protein